MSGTGIFTAANSAIGTVLSGSAATFNLLDYLGFGKVAPTSIVIAVVDLLLISAIAILIAILYNACSSLVGGLHPSLSDDE